MVSEKTNPQKFPFKSKKGKVHVRKTETTNSRIRKWTLFVDVYFEVLFLFPRVSSSELKNWEKNKLVI